MADKLGDPAGFALRTSDTCADNELDCGFTVSPFRACCPSGSYCPSQYNVNCCPSAANCTQLLVEKPKCANETWDLYDNNGYFCCEPGTIGYATKYNSDGCALPGYNFSSTDTLLRVISSGKAILATVTTTSSTSSFASSTSSTSSQTTNSLTLQSSTQIPEPLFAASSKDNTGAIVGGVVGGVAGVAFIAILVWWLLSRRLKRQSVAPGVQQAPMVKYTTKAHVMSELDGRTPVQELASPGSHPTHELTGAPVVYR